MARLLFIMLVSGGATSNDVRGWEAVAAALSRGENPYAATTFLNWPPLWVNVILIEDLAARFFAVPLFRVNQAFLIGADALLAVAAYGALRREFGAVTAFGVVLWGICLNPVSVLLTCVGGNFDVLVAIASVLFLGHLLEYLRGGERRDWLWSALALGFGVLAKTVPIVLTPLLAAGARTLRPKTLLFGGALVFGPALVGVSAIYLMAPAEVSERVINYRSVPGWFGVSGLLYGAGLPWFAKRVYPALFSLLVLGTALWCARRAAGIDREPLSGRETVWSAASLMGILPALGPGYGPHYSYWVLPILLFLYPIAAPGERRFLRIWWGIVVITCTVQYALAPGLGAFGGNFALLSPAVEWWRRSVGRWESTLITLPLFACYLIFLACCARNLLGGTYSGGRR